MEPRAAAGAGAYTVTMENFAGLTNVLAALVVVDIPLHFQLISWTSEGLFRVEVMGNPGQIFSLETSSNLQQWDPSITQQLTEIPFLFEDPGSGTSKQRYYRLR